MKILIITILSFLFCFTASIVLSEPVSIDNLVERNGLTYKNSSIKPFTGSMIAMDDSNFTHIGTFVDGKKEGPYKVFHANGRLMEKGIFKNGKFFPK